MNSKKKNPIISFDSVLVSQIPVCKQGLSGIRAGSIRRSKKVPHKENSQRPKETNLNDLKVKTSRDYIKSSIYKGRVRRPLSVSYEVHETPLQVAYYNFLPSLEDSRNSSPRARKKSLVKENKFLHKYFDKTLKPGTFESSDVSMTLTQVIKCSSSIQNAIEQEIPPEASNQFFPARIDLSDSEESPVKEFNQLLKPRFYGQIS
jgi:hypothetical protein